MESMITIVKFYPYWALPVAFVLFETGMFAKRHRKKGVDKAAFGLMGSLLILLVLWVAMRGDLNSVRWVMSWYGYH